MENKMDSIIPEQESGAKTDNKYSVTADSLNEARDLFNVVKERLQDVNNWHTRCGSSSAVFRLTDGNGNDVDRKVQLGDHFKISIPAPEIVKKTDAGEGHDWVVVEAIEDKSNSYEKTESFAIRVRPADNPKIPDEDVAHFFKNDATSSFGVEREGNNITTHIHGRNEKPNTTPGSVLDKARNALVALGAMAGLSNPQWKSLVKGLLENDK